jgi:type I restriction enzyme S subunit
MAAVSEKGELIGASERSIREVAKGFTYFESGDVLLAKITPCMENGKACLVPSLPYKAGFGSTEFHVLRATERIDPRYLFHCVWNDRFREAAEKNMTGSAGQKRVPSHFITSYKIPLPPLPEQKRIAAILDKADEIRRKREKAIELTDSFLRSVFLEMFGDPLRNPRKWEVKKLGTFLDAIESGWSPNCLNRPAQDNEWAILKLSAVSGGEFHPAENKALPQSEQPQEKLQVRRGDLLFTRKNTYDLVGSCAYVFHAPSKLMMPDTIFRLCIADSSQLSPLYLWGLLNNKAMRWQVKRLASGTSGSMPNISKGRLSEMDIMVPSSHLQSKYATIVKHTRLLQEKLAKSVLETTSLKASLSQRLLEGPSSTPTSNLSEELEVQHAL